MNKTSPKEHGHPSHLVKLPMISVNNGSIKPFFISSYNSNNQQKDFSI